MEERKRLSDVAALVRQGLPPAHMTLAADLPGTHPALGSPDRAVQGHQPGRFRKETGAGGESLSCAADICKEN